MAPLLQMNLSIFYLRIPSKTMSYSSYVIISNVHVLEAHKTLTDWSDLTNIDFDNIVIKNVKYLPFVFNEDVIFILPYAYGKTIDILIMHAIVSAKLDSH